jgi:3-phenylpropionate/trans-cinnamate dioxygenase ferredoxin component
MTTWVKACAFDAIDDEDVARFDHGERTFAIYRVDDAVYASDGLCTHEGVHLCDGLVMEHVIECPKHNGRFDVRDGRPLGAPVCVALKTYAAKVEGGQIWIEV